MTRKADYGMLENPDGTLSRTPQYETWKKNILVQLKDQYDSVPKMPVDLLTTDNHPQPSKLNLNWSYDGEWVLVPKYQSDQGTFLREYRVARIERYIELDGSIKKALSYGDSQDTINTWFKVEEIQKIFPKWNIPQPAKFYNGRRFNLKAKRESTNGNVKKLEFRQPSLNPVDQSTNDIQGFKGNRGGSNIRGSSSGSSYYQARGRGRNISRGGGNPSDRDSDRERDYRRWDEEQASGSGAGNRPH